MVVMMPASVTFLWLAQIQPLDAETILFSVPNPTAVTTNANRSFLTMGLLSFEPRLASAMMAFSIPIIIIATPVFITALIFIAS